GDALEFAKHFYTFLLDGKTIGEAVKQSRIKLRTSTGGSDLWASWVLFGNPHRHPFRVAG
ncbi:MAG: hypothetical protein ACE5I1_31250, partial [bacterium]